MSLVTSLAFVLILFSLKCSQLPHLPLSISLFFRYFHSKLVVVVVKEWGKQYVLDFPLNFGECNVQNIFLLLFTNYFSQKFPVVAHDMYNLKWKIKHIGKSINDFCSKALTKVSDLFLIKVIHKSQSAPLTNITSSRNFVEILFVCVWNFQLYVNTLMQVVAY